MRSLCMNLVMRLSLVFGFGFRGGGVHPGEESGLPLRLPNLEEDVVEDFWLPHYALPSVSSLLPIYANSQQDLVHRRFHTGNYDLLCHLPMACHQEVSLGDVHTPVSISSSSSCSSSGSASLRFACVCTNIVPIAA